MLKKIIPAIALIAGTSGVVNAGNWQYKSLDVNVNIEQNFIPDIDSAVRIIPVNYDSDPKLNSQLYTVEMTIPAGVSAVKIVPTDSLTSSGQQIGKLVNVNNPDQNMNYYIRNDSGAGKFMAGQKGSFSVKENTSYTFSAIYTGGEYPNSGYSSGTYAGHLTVSFYSN